MKKLVLIGGAIAFIVISTIIFISRPKPKVFQSNPPKTFNVIIQGEVEMTGSYLVVEGDTLQTLINYAQGLTNKADLSTINLNEVLQPNYKYTIPSKDNEDKVPFQYNLNEVNYNTLITIPGITETRAINILTYREQNNKFNSVEELLNVKGIGEVTYDKIKDYFYIR